MSKVIVYHAPYIDSYQLNAATITSGWLPGQWSCLDSTGLKVRLSTSTLESQFVFIDAPTEVASPPSGSLVSCLYGPGSKILIDHSDMVAAGTTTAAYLAYSKTDIEAASINQLLYVDANGKFTTTQPGTGSSKARVWQVPSSTNSYGLGVWLRD